MSAPRPNKLSRGYTQYQSVPLPERWPLDPRMNTRSAEADQLQKDACLVNCYAELDPEDNLYNIQKRPGLFNPGLHTPPGNGLGIYNWLTDIYSVFGTKLFKNNAAFVPVIDNGSTYRFEQVLGATPKLVLKNNTQGWYTDGFALTQITDPDFPVATCVGMAYLDGTIYVMRFDGGIQGSAIDDPSSWDPLNLIIARNEPDRGIALIKHGTYVVAIKQWSTQAFANVGNATGSPLGRVDGFMYYYGCRNGNTVREIDGKHFWVSANRQAESQVVKLENLSLEVISTPVIDRIVTRFGNASFAFMLKTGGHSFYCIALSAANFTLVYDIGEKLWYRWTDSTGASIWPIIDSTFSGDNVVLQGVITYTYSCETDYSQPTDNGELIPVDIYTNSFDFGLDRSKQLNIMYFKGDIVRGSVLQVRVTDDDYNSYSNFRSVDLGNTKPMLTGCGSFDQRALHLRHRCATSFRLKAIGLQLDIGSL